VPRINKVKKAQKPQGNCGGCGKPIKKGDGYRWIKFRYGGRRVRCMDTKCVFKDSDLTQSKMSEVYSARETLEAAVNDWDGEDAEDLRSALSDAADSVRSVADEYQNSADSIKDRFSESQTADDCEEKANALNEWADELESAADEFDDKPEVEEDRCKEMDEDDELRCTEDKDHEDDCKFDAKNAGTKPDDEESELDSWRASCREVVDGVVGNLQL